MKTLHFVTILFFDINLQMELKHESFAVSTSKSRLKVIATSASCGAFILLILVAVLAYRYHQFHKEKNDIFVDVAGNFCFPRVVEFVSMLLLVEGT
jgi:hypothetical protein